MEGNAMVVARLIATREDKSRLIVEVHQDATFHQFYHVFTQRGDDAGSKKKVRVCSRNEGIKPHYRAWRVTPGLYKVAEWLMKGVAGYKSVKIHIIDQETYERLIHADPDTLKLTRTVSRLPHGHHWQINRSIPVAIPSTFTPLKKRFEIITGR